MRPVLLQPRRVYSRPAMFQESLPLRPLPRALPASLDLALLERSDGQFIRVGLPPEWFDVFFGDPGRPNSGLDLASRSLFLENFLLDAEAHWAAGSAQPLRSGPWTETAPDGRERPLEAMALTLDGRALLLIGPPALDFAGMQQIFQSARQEALDRQRIQREIERREVLLHCIVHDLGNPLGSVRGALQLLDDDLKAGATEAEATQQLLTIALRQADRMREMIRSILDVFRAEVDAFNPAADRTGLACDAALVVRRVVEALGPRARTRQQALAMVGVDDPCLVVAEENRLERVVYNLLDNALRYTPADEGATVTLRRDAGAVWLTIDDAGPGVPESVRPFLFQAFSQVGGRPGKAGLGLYFCRIAVKAWGGDVGVLDAPGGGARFQVRLDRPAQAIPLAGSSR
ncbi:MAG: HAMP domain-containing sensor histidine kinase [Bacteroidota bacterium]